jgi:hypothetical protein
MNHCRSIRLAISVLPVLLTSCAMFGDSRPGVAKVEDLVSRVERVHVETELARDAAAAAVRELRALTAPGFRGDAAGAYRAVSAAAEASRQHAIQLRESVSAMQIAARPVFDQWAAQVDAIGNASVRARSEDRLRRARERYEAIDSNLRPALDEFDALNCDVRDLLLFLSVDFNSASVATIQTELASLDGGVARLDARLGRSLVAAQGYLEVAARRGDEALAAPAR